MKRIYHYLKLHKEIFFLLPILSFNLVFILGGTIKGFIDSFGNTFYINGWFLEGRFIFQNRSILHSLLYTFKIALISALFSLTIALVIIYIIHMSPELRKTIKRFFYLPILTPYLLIGFFMLYTFSTSGFFNRILYHFGLIESLSAAPIYINDPSGLGIILAYIWKASPFFTMFILSVYENFNQQYLLISTSLGATQTKTFFTIVLPYLKKSIIYATVIIFIFIFSAIEIPLILGATRPQTLSQWAYQNFQNGSLTHRSQSLAINSSILILNMFIISVIAFSFFKEKNHEKDL